MMVVVEAVKGAKVISNPVYFTVLATDGLTEWQLFGVEGGGVLYLWITLGIVIYIYEYVVKKLKSLKLKLLRAFFTSA